MKKRIILAAIFVVLTGTAPAGPDGGDEPQAILIKNATIIPVVGDRIEQGQLLIRDGKIAGLGKSLTAPDGALVIDAAGQFVYPGFIDGYSHFGLTEISAIASTSDVREMGKENPELRVIWAINPGSVHFGTGRVNGTTAALVAPSGGTFPGIVGLGQDGRLDRRRRWRSRKRPRP